MSNNNSGFGDHPTQYARLNNDQLYAMFRESVYSRLEESEKLDLLQETVNRDALEKGMVGAPQVQFGNLPATEGGNAANGYITLNRDMATLGIQTVEYNGQVFYHQMEDYNVQALNTVLHEDEHCFQEQVINGTIYIQRGSKRRNIPARFSICVGRHAIWLLFLLFRADRARRISEFGK